MPGNSLSSQRSRRGQSQPSTPRGDVRGQHGTHPQAHSAHTHTRTAEQNARPDSQPARLHTVHSVSLAGTAERGNDQRRYLPFEITFLRSFPDGCWRTLRAHRGASTGPTGWRRALGIGGSAIAKVGIQGQAQGRHEGRMDRPAAVPRLLPIALQGSDAATCTGLRRAPPPQLPAGSFPQVSRLRRRQAGWQRAKEAAAKHRNFPFGKHTPGHRDDGAAYHAWEAKSSRRAASALGVKQVTPASDAPLPGACHGLALPWPWLAPTCPNLLSSIPQCPLARPVPWLPVGRPLIQGSMRRALLS